MNTEQYQLIDHIKKEEWYDILRSFNDANIYQTWSYGKVRWGEKKLSHIVLYKEDEVVGAAQVIIKKLPIINRGIAYVRWGPIWRVKGKEDDIENLRRILKALIEEYVIKRNLLLRVIPNEMDCSGENVVKCYESENFQKKILEVYSHRTFLLNLEQSLEQLRKKLDAKWRNQLNRAEKNGLSIIEGTDYELYNTFLMLQQELLERKKYSPGVDYDEFGAIQKDLPEDFKMRIFVCLHEGIPVASSVISAVGNKGIYLLGATGNNGLNLKGSYLLQWRMIQWLKEIRCCSYDLGGINPEKNPGVYEFKAGLKGSDTYYLGCFEISKDNVSPLVIRYGEYLLNCKKKISGNKR